MIDLTKEQIAAIEKPHKRRMWGEDVDCEPKLVRQALGNGDQLLGIGPINTRPNYYVIRVDSSWHLDGCGCKGDCPGDLRDHLHEVYEAIEDEYDNADDSQSDWDESTGEPCPEKLPWPALSDDPGVSWFEYEIPESV